MRCLLCQSFSFSFICTKCRKRFLAPVKIKRQLNDVLTVYSFYRYKDIEILLKTKHKYVGHTVYNILAKESMAKFKKEYPFSEYVDIVPIDDVASSGYAHTAILAKALRTKYLKPYYGSMRAANRVTYSAKCLAFREANPRGFTYLKKRHEYAILVDDIVTTGTTLKEAQKVLDEAGVKTLFALTLANASDL